MSNQNIIDHDKTTSLNQFPVENVKKKGKGLEVIISLLKEYNGVLSLFASIVLGIWGINLTRKYGENKDNLNRLDSIVQKQSVTNSELKEFVKLQNKANKQLIDLDSSADQQHSALLKVLASNNMLVEEQGWNTFNDINENVASLLTSWQSIYSIYINLKQNRQNIKNGIYESSIDAMDIFL